MALTGTIDFRKSWFGGIVLQVEEEVTGRFSGKHPHRHALAPLRRSAHALAARSVDGAGPSRPVTHANSPPPPIRSGRGGR